MENGVEALKIASGMLIFVLAITITISAFTTASQAMRDIFTAKDAQEYVTDADGNYLNFVSWSDDVDGGTRKVGVDTIIPSIYRAYKENYAIYFYDSEGNDFVLYEKENGEKVNYIDLQKEVHASAEKAIEHINDLLYNKGLYRRLKEGTFIEKLGEYYMDDVSGATGTAEINKIKKRVITYTQE